jgi:NADH:ubiquinone oxidoreductase subunit E
MPPTPALRSLPDPSRNENDRHVIVVCTGEQCADAGAKDLLDTLRCERKHARGELRTGEADCMGHCALAPAVMEDGRLLGAMSSRRLRSELMRLGVLDTE